MDVAQQKVYRRIIKQSRADSKLECCPICHRKQTSFCNSHTVPQFVLRNIAEKGMITQSTIFAFDNSPDETKGVNNTGTFHCICRECDQIVFSDYESEEKLLSSLTKRKLAQIALKNTLQLYNSAIDTEAIHNIYQAEHKLYQNKLALDQCSELDKRDYQYYIDRYVDIIHGKHDKGFEQVYYRRLPYITPIATQVGITVHRSISGRIINDVYDDSEEKKMQQIHVCIFPLRKETLVVMFYHKNDRKYAAFSDEFSQLSESAKLQYITYMVFKYSEMSFFSPTLSDAIKNNEKLRILARENYDYPNLGYIELSRSQARCVPVKYGEIPNLLGPELKLI